LEWDGVLYRFTTDVFLVLQLTFKEAVRNDVRLQRDPRNDLRTHGIETGDQ